MTSVKLRIRLENLKYVFARVCFNIAMTSDRLSFASDEIYLYGGLCHRRSRDQPQTEVFLPTTKGDTEERAWE